jgi:conserved oligomeric Golgi complex subunit 3
MPDTVSSVLSRTSTLLPGSLFTSLASTRTEHLADAKRVRSIRFSVHYCASHTLFFSFLQGIDQDLKRACEAVISMASEPLCAPLRAFTGRPASAAEAAVLDDTFRTACASDLRSSLARVRLYVSEARTAAVLVQHAVDRVEDAYGAFRLAARQVGARVAGGNGLMDDEALKSLLKDVCGEEANGVGSRPGKA